MRLRQQTGVVRIIRQNLDSANCGMRDNGHTHLVRMAYSWPMRLGRPWPRATLCRELLIDDGDHGQDSQAHQSSHDLRRQYPAQAERSPSIKNTPQTSTDRGVDKTSRDNAK